jgi:hypothetical protein
MKMSEGATLVRAMKYIRDICVEIEVASKRLRERFRQILPDDYSCDERYDKWQLPRSSPAFFGASGCLIKVKRKPNSYFGCASYMFDLGGDGTLATKSDESLVVVGWTGRRWDIDGNCYYSDDLDSLPKDHVKVFGTDLWCWREEGKDPRLDNRDDQSWYYTVPLFSLRNSDDVERLLIKPLIALATAPQLTDPLVKQAFHEQR